MLDAGLAFDAARVLYGKPETASGKAMAQQALALTPRPTALFATNNFITIGAFAALREAGLRVPDDISLAGFDDLPDGLILDPFLTVATPAGLRDGPVRGRAAAAAAGKGRAGGANRNRLADGAHRPPLHRAGSHGSFERTTKTQRHDGTGRLCERRASCLCGEC